MRGMRIRIYVLGSIARVGEHEVCVQKEVSAVQHMMVTGSMLGSTVSLFILRLWVGTSHA